MIIIYFIYPKSGMSFTRKRLTRQFVMLLELTAYTGWVSGTLAGFVLGTCMPAVLTQSMGVALYALLLAILMPELKTSLRSLVLAVASGFFNWFLVMVDLLPKGWSIIVCIFVVASAGVFLNPGFVKEENIHYSKKSWTRFVNLLSNYINEQIGRS